MLLPVSDAKKTVVSIQTEVMILYLYHISVRSTGGQASLIVYPRSAPETCEMTVVALSTILFKTDYHCQKYFRL